VGWIAFLFALVAGAAITVQAGSNSQLKQSLGNPIGALVVNYVLALMTIVLVAVIARVSIPAAHKITSTPWWAWTGGLLGILYGLAVVFLASQMGAATLIAAVVTGQLVFSVVVDNFGWIGFEIHHASPLRILGCVLMVTGLAFIARF
jgi:bacterial/archaeal transporter family-2 protein